jgi:cell fate regulator YaaT (PSP1 superfamily)
MPILPLPQFEEDLKQLQEDDRKVYEALSAPKSLVVRFGSMKMVGEFPYDGTVKPGCGSKIVVRTHRGTEMGEMLTSTCANSGCGKSVSRKEMLTYIENSGGRDYPFFQDGRVLRIATMEDMQKQEQLEQAAHAMRLEARRVVEPLKLPLKIVAVEPILGGERLTIHYTSEDRLDLTNVFRALQGSFGPKLDIKHVGPRDEARITADYEKCGQYCCCKNFLKVLKPISMKSAKIQKATLDPVKISGRCGRLMCCLRYEDETYDELRKRLPNKKKRVGTPEGDGIVIDSQILTQLVLVRLDNLAADGKIQEVAIPVESLVPPTNAVAPAGSVNSPTFVPAEMPMRGERRPMGHAAGAGPRGGGAPPSRGSTPQTGAPPAPNQGDARPQPPRRGPTESRDVPGGASSRPQSMPPRAANAPASKPSDDVDDIMAGLDADDGDTSQPRRGPHSGPPGGSPPSGPGQGGGRRRRRRRGGGPNRGGGGTSGGPGGA